MDPKVQQAINIAIQRGFTPQQAQAAAQVYMSQQPAPVPAKKPFQLSDLLPIAGGIVGGVGGAFAGPVGAIGGGAAGSAAGEALRQRITGEDTNLGKIGTEGALGLLGGVGGEVIGGGLRLGAKLLPKAATAATTRQAGTVSRMLSNKATQAGESLALKNLRPTKTQLAKFKGKHGVDLAKFLSEGNLIGQSADDVERTAIKPLQAQFDKIVNSEKVIASPKTLDDILMQKLKPLIDSPTTEDQQIAERVVKKYAELTKRYGEKGLSLKTLNSDRKAFDSKVNYTRMSSNPVEFGENKILADALRETIQGTAESAGNKGLKEIGLQLNKLYSARDIMNIQSNLGRGNLPVGLTTLLGLTGGGAMGPVGAPLMAVAATAANNPRVIASMAKGTIKVGDRLAQGTPTSTRLLTSGIGQGITQTAIPRSSQSYDEVSLPTESDPFMDTGFEEEVPETPRITDEQLAQLLLMDAITNKGRNAATIQAVGTLLKGKQKKPLTAEQGRTKGYVARIQQSNQLFDELESQVAPKLTGKSSGLFYTGRKAPDRLKGEGIKRQEQAERNFINALLRRESGAAISPTEFESAALQYFPQPGDTKAVLAQKRRNRLLVQKSMLDEVSGAQDSVGDLLNQLSSR